MVYNRQYPTRPKFFPTKDLGRCLGKESMWNLVQTAYIDSV